MAVVDIVRVDTAQYLLDTNRPVVVDTGLLGTFQIGVATLLHPAQGGFVVIKTDGTDGTCRITCLTSLRTGCILTEQATTCLFVDIQLSHDDLFLSETILC